MTAKLTATYARKPFYVDAVQVTKENMELVAAWCGGEIRTHKNQSKYIFVRVIRPIKETQCMAFVGDWVLGAGTSYKVYKDRVFRETFELSSGKKELQGGVSLDGGPCGKTGNTVDHAPCILNKGHEDGPNGIGCRSVKGAKAA